jgi:hypothetical protein
MGWCSWYNLYAYLSEAILLDHLRSVREVVERERLPMWVFQIDDGFTPEMGDWLEGQAAVPTRHDAPAGRHARCRVHAGVVDRAVHGRQPQSPIS